jgi:hypothetical protein
VNVSLSATTHHTTEYGGSSPGTGPTYAADPVFYTAIAQLIK